MKLLRGLLVLLACLFLGKALVWATQVPIPGAIAGLLILLLLLTQGLVPGHWLAPGATPLIRHMTLLFIPAGVGLIHYLAELQSHWLALLGTTVISTLVVMVLVGRFHQARSRHD